MSADSTKPPADEHAERVAARASAWVAALVTMIVAGTLAVPFVEDWDGAGFVLASRRIDLAHFRPHPPGYPAYTGVARALGALGASTATVVRALSTLSAVGLAMFSAGLAMLLPPSRRSLFARAAIASLAALALPGTLRLATSVTPTSLALGSWALALGFAHTNRDRPKHHWVSGALLGLAVSSRPTDVVPIAAVTLALWPERAPAVRIGAIAALVTGAMHGVLILGVGIQSFVRLARAHGVDHFERVGNSVDTPARRLATMAAYATEHTSAAAMACTVALVCASLLVVLTSSARRARVLVCTSICVAWWCIVQPALVERHLAWLAALAAIGLSQALAGELSPWIRRVALVLALATTMLGVRASIDRHRVAPAAVQIAAHVRSRGGPLFGARHARAAELEGVDVFVARYEGEVWSTLSRMQRLPSIVWLTDEVEPWPTHARDVAVFCGPRSSRGEPQCMRVRAIFPRETTR